MMVSRNRIAVGFFPHRGLKSLGGLLIVCLILSCAPAPDRLSPEKTTPPSVAESAQALSLTRPSGAALQPASLARPGPTPPASLAGLIAKPSYAGLWYSSDAEDLADEVDGYLANIHPVDGAPLVLIVPQAQYALSGKISAAGYQQLKNGSYETAIILASAEYPPHPSPIAVWAVGAYETPLGLVKVDQFLAESIISADPLVKRDERVFVTEPGIEIQLPFIQRVCPKCGIVPILIDDDDDAAVLVLARVLAAAMRKGKTVLIAGSNLSQYPNQKDAMPLDNETLSAIQVANADVFSAVLETCRSKNIPNLETCANGETAVRTAINTANLLGAETVSVLNYGNSGDSTNGDPERVTGYGVVMFWHYEPPVLDEENRQQLLSLARTTLANRLSDEKATPVLTDDPVYQRKCGAFVVLKLDGKIRGSMGHMRADLPLAVVIQEMTLAALNSDPRFALLTVEELQRLKIEISITSPPQRLASIEEVVLGTHGLLIQDRNHQGVLLPQVPVENNWGRNRYLDHLCMVAGLKVNCWKKETTVYSFTTITFGD